MAPQKADVRIIAAIHQSLSERFRQGAFREDLYCRLKVVKIHTPPPQGWKAPGTRRIRYERVRRRMLGPAG